MHAAQRRVLRHQSYYRRLQSAKHFSGWTFDKKLDTLTYLLQDYGHASGLSIVLRQGRCLPNMVKIRSDFYTSDRFLGLKELAQKLEAQRKRLRSEERKADFAEFEAVALPLAADLTEILSSDTQIKTVVLKLHHSVNEQLRAVFSKQKQTETEEFNLVGQLTNVMSSRTVTFNTLDKYHKAAEALIAKLQLLGVQVALPKDTEDELEVALLMRQTGVL